MSDDWDDAVWKPVDWKAVLYPGKPSTAETEYRRLERDRTLEAERAARLRSEAQAQAVQADLEEHRQTAEFRRSSVTESGAMNGSTQDHSPERPAWWPDAEHALAAFPPTKPLLGEVGNVRWNHRDSRVAVELPRAKPWILAAAKRRHDIFRQAISHARGAITDVEFVERD